MTLVRRQGNWPLMVVEFFLLVFGILAALALDDWNAARKDRELEVEYLADLSEDLRLDLAQIEETRGAALGRLLVAQRLLDAAGDRAPAPADRQLDLSDTVLVDVEAGLETDVLLNVAVLDGASAAFDELRSSGNLRGITNRRLVRLLSQYYSMWAAEVEGDINRMRPDAAYLRAALSRVGLTVGHSLTPGEVRSIVERDPVIRGELRQLHLQARNQIWRHQSILKPVADSALAVIESELAAKR